MREKYIKVRLFDHMHNSVITKALLMADIDPVSWFTAHYAIGIFDVDDVLKFINGDVVCVKDGKTDIDNYCETHHIDRKDFNSLVWIEESATDLTGLLAGCKSFNHPLFIPETVKVCCDMLYGCESLNDVILIDDGPYDFTRMLGDCKSFNRELMIPIESTLLIPAPKGLWIPSKASVELYYLA